MDHVPTKSNDKENDLISFHETGNPANHLTVRLVTGYPCLPRVTSKNLTHTNTITMKKIVMRNLSQFSFLDVIERILGVGVITGGQPIITHPTEREQNIPQTMIGE
ncbi:hypothetical protein DK846_12575 [Methanospirillum lacunae]|uniref:Uncharacterized protein n=1 Tax=Methanospirillum lacunae TaxID=668570 RepID=A0A2V2MU03_9EURY|nr:hypothetical protein DK846_12575 [Methanospirillum lacunae]